MMEMNEYQTDAWKTAVHPDKGNNWIYVAMGLGGEIGEILNKLKKVIRDEDGKISDEKKADLGDEIGDVLWYVASLCTELGLDLGDVAKNNLDKLSSRMERNQIKGSGDKR